MTATTPTTVAVTQLSISQEATLLAMEAALAEAQSLEQAISVCVVDRAGRLMGFLRSPNAFGVTIDMAQRKARCAASLGLPMNIVDGAFDQEHPRVRRGLEAHPDVTPVHGGLPLHHQGQLMGAIGVSGASEAQDLQCAQAGVDALAAAFPISD